MASFTNLVLLLVLLSFFYGSAVVVPIVAAEFGESTIVVSGNLEDSSINDALVIAESGNISPFNVFGVTINMIKLAWIGQINGLHVTFDLVYTLFALATLLLALVCLVPTIGGGA